MIPAFFLFISIAASSVTETPFLAYDLAKSISSSSRFDWIKMEDEQGNVRYVITFYSMPNFANKNFEKTLLEQNRKK